MVHATGTKGINGSGFPVTDIVAVGFVDITSVEGGTAFITPGPVIGITAIGTAVTAHIALRRTFKSDNV